MSTLGDVHVGDNWQTYKAKIEDAGVPFDPTTATTKTLIWATPSGVLTRAATVTTDGTNWYLVYTLVPGVDDAFHALPGIYQWQGFVQFADGSKGKTNVGRYVVERNLN